MVIGQVETQGLQLNYPVDAIRYIRGFWLEYRTNTTSTSFVNVTELDSSVTKVSVRSGFNLCLHIIMYILQIFLGQNDNDYTASKVQDLPQPIATTVVRIYPTDSVPDTRVCLKLELHGCVPQREEGMQ